MNRLFICTVLVLAGCSEHARLPDSTRTTALRASVERPSVEADSARAFTQRFYDWYTAAQAGRGTPYDSLVASRRGWLSDTLARALQEDMAMQRADTIAEIASLSAEADIFLNSQDPCSHYTARDPRSLGAAGVAISVAGNCNGLDAKPNIQVQVRRRAGSWVIVNLKDPTEPSYDLLSAFTRYRAEMHSPQDTTGNDTSKVGRAGSPPIDR